MPSASTPKVISCGNIAYDLIMDDKARPPVFHARPGGSVANTVILLRRLGIRVSLLARVGNDFLGEGLIRELKKEGVDAGSIRRDKKLRTSLAFAKIDRRGDSSYVFYTPQYGGGAFRGRNVLSLMDSSAVFHTGSIYSYDDGTFGECLFLLKEAEKRKLFTTYDPNWRPDRVRDKKEALSRIRALLRHVDLLKISMRDAVGIGGSNDPEKALKKIRGYLKGEIVVTCGATGSFWRNERGRIFCPAFKVKVVDTIGAGDAFTAGLIHRYLLLGKKKFLREKKENLVFASAAAALACTAHGAVDGLKNKQQVMKFIETRYFLS